MEPEEKKWLEEAIEQCSRATAKNVTVLLQRSAEQGESEMYVTNATTPAMIRALYDNYGPTDSGDGE